MWDQMGDSRDCSGFVFTTRSDGQEAPTWRVSRHGGLQLVKRKDANEGHGPGDPVYIHLCEARAAGRSARSEAAKQCRRKMRNRKTPCKKKRGRDKPSKCDDCRDVGRAEWPRQRSLAHATFQQPRATTICMPLFFSRLLNRPASVSLATMSNSSSSSHDRSRMERGLEGMGRFYDCRTSRIRADPR